MYQQKNTYVMQRSTENVVKSARYCSLYGNPDQRINYTIFTAS